MNTNTINDLLNDTELIRSFYEKNGESLAELNANNDENHQFSCRLDSFTTSLSTKNSNFLYDNSKYLSKRITPNNESPWIDFLCSGTLEPNKYRTYSENVNLLQISEGANELFWKGLTKYLNENKADIFKYIGDYMFQTINETYIGDLKTEKEHIDNLIKRIQHG